MSLVDRGPAGTRGDDCRVRGVIECTTGNTQSIENLHTRKKEKERKIEAGVLFQCMGSISCDIDTGERTVRTLHLFVQGDFSIQVFYRETPEVLVLLHMIGFEFCHRAIQDGLATCCDIGIFSPPGGLETIVE
jgi:hypothetical protein